MLNYGDYLHLALLCSFTLSQTHARSKHYLVETADNYDETGISLASDEGNKNGCPKKQPRVGNPCSVPGSERCSYGSECCCGRCHPSFVASCTGRNGWMGFNTDACMRPNCGKADRELEDLQQLNRQWQHGRQIRENQIRTEDESAETNEPIKPTHGPGDSQTSRRGGPDGPQGNQETTITEMVHLIEDLVKTEGVAEEKITEMRQNLTEIIENGLLGWTPPENSINRAQDNSTSRPEHNSTIGPHDNSTKGSQDIPLSGQQDNPTSGAQDNSTKRPPIKRKKLEGLDTKRRKRSKRH